MPKNQASKDVLIRTAIEVWEAFEKEILEDLIDTMMHRVEAGIRSINSYG